MIRNVFIFVDHCQHLMNVIWFLLTISPHFCHCLTTNKKRKWLNAYIQFFLSTHFILVRHLPGSNQNQNISIRSPPIKLKPHSTDFGLIMKTKRVATGLLNASQILWRFFFLIMVTSKWFIHSFVCATTIFFGLQSRKNNSEINIFVDIIWLDSAAYNLKVAHDTSVKTGENKLYIQLSWPRLSCAWT